VGARVPAGAWDHDGAIALAGLLYLEARQRAREISYAFRGGWAHAARHAISVTLEWRDALIAWFSACCSQASRRGSCYLKWTPARFPAAGLYRVPLPLIGLIALALLVVAAVGPGACSVQRIGRVWRR